MNRTLVFIAKCVDFCTQSLHQMLRTMTLKHNEKYPMGYSHDACDTKRTMKSIIRRMVMEIPSIIYSKKMLFRSFVFETIRHDTDDRKNNTLGLDVAQRGMQSYDVHGSMTQTADASPEPLKTQSNPNQKVTTERESSNACINKRKMNKENEAEDEVIDMKRNEFYVEKVKRPMTRFAIAVNCSNGYCNQLVQDLQLLFIK
eukprot:103066_1